MNETMKTILNRRSIRQYKSEQIKEEELQTTLEAVKYAPSGGNTQPWHFTVVQNKEMLHRINECCMDVMEKIGRIIDENYSVFYNAPTLIIVSGAKIITSSQHSSPETVMTCAMSLGNMFLAAESLNIGSCWIHAPKILFDTVVGNVEVKALLKHLGISGDISVDIIKIKTLIKDLDIPQGYDVIGSGAFGYKTRESTLPSVRRNNTTNFIK